MSSTLAWHHGDVGVLGARERADRAVRQVRDGGLVLLIHDGTSDRGGELVAAAECVTPQVVNAMTRHARGIVGLPITGARLDELGIPLMVPGRTSAAVAYTVSVDIDEPGNTGISAADRARCIRRMLDPGATAQDFRRPGHVFPVRAHDGGVLAHPGPAEAGVDLARLAEWAPAAVRCPVMARDGHMARGAQLDELAAELGIPTVTIADVLAHPRAEGLSMRRTGARPARWADVDVRDVRYRGGDVGELIALVLGAPDRVPDAPVSVHLECPRQALGTDSCACAEQLGATRRRMMDHGAGVLILVRGSDPHGEDDTSAVSARRRRAAVASVLADLGMSESRAEDDLGVGELMHRPPGVACPVPTLT